MSARITRLAGGRLHYAWIIVALTALVAMLAAGVRAAPGVLIVPFEEEFHWSRATISLAVGINLLVYGAIGPFAAAAMDRFGVGRTMALALAATGIGVALTPTMTETWQLILLWGFVVGIGTGFLGWFISAYIAMRWFRTRQGFVMGLLTAANAAGQLAFLPAMAELTTRAGWRAMSLLLAAVVIGFVPVLVWLMRDRPADIGLAPYGGFSADPPAAPAGNPVGAAFQALFDGARSRDFWLLAGAYTEAYPAVADLESLNLLRHLLSESGHRWHCGLIWSTDAVLLETSSSVRYWSSRNVIGVDMESGALFTVARLLGVQAAAILVASDNPAAGLETDQTNLLAGTAAAVELSLEFAARMSQTPSGV